MELEYTDATLQRIGCQASAMSLLAHIWRVEQHRLRSKFAELGGSRRSLEESGGLNKLIAFLKSEAAEGVNMEKVEIFF